MKDKPKVILVSGGSRGLGAGIVEHLLRASSHRVITFSRRKNEVINRLKRKYKSRFYYEEMDQTDITKMKAFMNRVEKKFRRCDVLINNAGIARDGVLPIFQEEAIRSLIQLNLESTIQLTRLASRVMIRQQSGSIINVSSIIGFRGFSGLSVYAATKAAAIGFTKSLARELGKKNIRVNIIAPGYLETDMSSSLSPSQRAQIERRTPLGRLGKVKDVLPMIDFLISNDSAFVTGQTFVVDGGASI